MINKREWKEFKIGKKFGGIFDWKIGNISKTSTEEGKYPLISCSTINNGVIGTTNKADFQNCISVSTNGSCGKCFYQKGRFGASTDTIMLFHNKLNENNALFICTVIEKQLMGKYGYNNKNKGDKTLNISILLPVDSFGQPDWKYMEESVRQLEESVRQQLCKAIPKLSEIDTSNWKQFKLCDLFIYEKSKGYKVGQLISGDIPYIARVAVNNGVSRTAGNQEKHYPANTITIHHEWKDTWVSFYQPKEYITDGMIGILKPKFNLTENIGLFISCLINKQPASGPVSNAINISILLPVDSFGQPDWKYMEEYMKPINKK